jgi:two-component system response regulator HydG
VTGVETGEAALERLENGVEPFDLLIVDVHLPGIEGPEVVDRARIARPQLPIILMSGAPGEAARLGHRRGAYDFLTKPFDPPEELLGAIERALERTLLLGRTSLLEGMVDAESRRPFLVGSAPAFTKALALLDAVAPTDSSVLVLGESGTGKELAARSIHAGSARRTKPFVAVNCGAFTETLLDSELFGHVRGAFTGAFAPHKGVFEQASGGTIFLDEVGELSLATQVRLLRVLEERRVKPVGSTSEVPVDVRLVAATHRDLNAAVREGRFREDLYYRINVVALGMPALRERREDIPLLVRHLLSKQAASMGRPVPRVSAAMLDVLMAYEWPGNVRELRNALERCMVLEPGEELTAASLPENIRPTRVAAAPGEGAYDSPFADALAAFQRAYLAHVLKSSEGNIAEAARRSGIDRANLRRMLRRHGLLPGRE